MNQQDVREKLIELFRSTFYEFDMDHELLVHIDLIDDLGMDSILFVSLIVEIEFLFGITIPDDMLEQDNFNTLGKIESFVFDLIKNKDDENAKQTNKNA